ncbi:MAG: hypothetical protein AAFY83_00645 [Pseudomonadota bacterium]
MAPLSSSASPALASAPSRGPIQRLPGIAPKLSYVGRRFHAWWEGYAFDPYVERRSVLLQHSRAGRPLASLDDQADLVAEAIWGPGRIEPGSPAWTLHLARSLMIDTHARVAVLGAGRGAPLFDLKTGTRWRTTGYTRRACPAQGVRLIDYSHLRKRAGRNTMDGGMILFEAHRESDVVQPFRLLSDLIGAGGKGVAVDFTVPRREIRLKSAFASPWQGVAHPAATLREAAEKSRFDVIGEVDDTPTFIPLVRQGWAGWRSAWQILNGVADNRQRAGLVTLLGTHANLWAERLEALEAGYLQVTRLILEKRHH